jgi:hypothetical protein
LTVVYTDMHHAVISTYPINPTLCSTNHTLPPILKRLLVLLQDDVHPGRSVDGDGDVHPDRLVDGDGDWDGDIHPGRSMDGDRDGHVHPDRSVDGDGEIEIGGKAKRSATKDAF